MLTLLCLPGNVEAPFELSSAYVRFYAPVRPGGFVHFQALLHSGVASTAVLFRPKDSFPTLDHDAPLQRCRRRR